MVKNPIKVYGRIKPVLNKNQAEEYEIHEAADDFETLSFNLKPHGLFNAKPECISFRYQKVFNTSNQEEVFNIVAKPVVDSVLQGYNGTIFAYGQTGSGKTYSMTGGLSRYEDRGVIPRTIQHIFKHFLEAGVTHSTFISYLEIYNECGYDLLNPNHKVSKLDDLPRVVLMEDTSGTMNLRNLSMHPVSSEEEALNLLFLGDTNRMISETPMNPSSSRSHCVFTVHVVTRSASSSAVRRSKLHLIDLAGSERVHKTGIDGNLLQEARYINLSLHYLEQVIVALADSRRSHVPYRNSMMTTVLRDSLGGNCMTAMLATLSSHKSNIDETLSTCRFAQRVALVRNEAMLNEEKDPQQEIALLRADVRRLKEQIAVLTTPGVQPADELTEAEVTECRAWVQEYLRRDAVEEASGTSASPQSTVIDVTGTASEAPAPASLQVQVPSDPRKVRLCFSMLRAACCERAGQGLGQALGQSGSASPKQLQSKVASQVEHFREIIRQRDSEISILINLLRKEKQRSQGSASPAPSPAPSPVPSPAPAPAQQAQHRAAPPHAPPPSPGLPATDYECVIGRFIGQNFTLAEREAFKIFAADRKNRIEVEMTKEALRSKFEEAKLAAARIKLTRKRMVSLHNEMKLLSDLDPTERVKKAALQDELGNEQASYRKTLMDLQLLKVETGHQKHAVEQAKLRLLRKFQDWWAAQISCCSGLSAPATVDAADLPDQDSAASARRPQSCQGARPATAAQLQALRVRPWSAGQAGPVSAAAPPAPCHTGSMPCFCNDPSRQLAHPPPPAPTQQSDEASPTEDVTIANEETNTPPITTLWTRLSKPYSTPSSAACGLVANDESSQKQDEREVVQSGVACGGLESCRAVVVRENGIVDGIGVDDVGVVKGEVHDEGEIIDGGEAADEVQNGVLQNQSAQAGRDNTETQTILWRLGGQRAPPCEDEEYIRSHIALTGEPEVDREIIEFYKARNRMSRGHTV